MDGNNRLDGDSEFWKMVRKKSSHDLDDRGNKIPPVRPIEELMELVMQDPHNIRNFTKTEKEIFKAEMDRQQEEFKNMPYQVQKEILDKTLALLEKDPNLSEEDKKQFREMNDKFLKELKAGKTPNDEVDSLIAYGESGATEEEEVIEPVDVNSFLQEVYGEVQVLKEYKRSDYSVEVDEQFVKFHVNGEVPPMTSHIFKDLIAKLSLTYKDNGFWEFPRTAAELNYWLKEEKLI